MKLSTKGRYGARAALELAIRYGSGLVMVHQIARSQDISVRYLEHILNALRAAGIVTSTRGAKGGYELAKPPSDISLGEVVQALEGPMNIVSCAGGSSVCSKISECVMNGVWTEVKNAIVGVLDSITLEELVKRYHEIHKKNAYDYII
jgi:Rrf2 family protein